MKAFLAVSFRSLCSLRSFGSAFIVSMLIASPVLSAEVRVMVSGKFFGSIDAYKVLDRYYLNAKEAGSIYDGRVYWYPVTGKIQMSVRGKQAQFLVNSDEAHLDGKSVKLPTQVLARASNAFIPIEFFMSPEFSELVGMDSQFKPETGILTVDRRTTVGPLRWYSYKDYTQVVLELGKRLGWSTTRQGRGAFSISVPMGKIDWPEDVTVGDGMVGTMRLTQGPRAVTLSLRLAEREAKYDIKETQDPRRLVIDVYTNAAAMREAKMSSAPPVAGTGSPKGKPSPEDVLKAAVPQVGPGPAVAPEAATGAPAPASPKAEGPSAPAGATGKPAIATPAAAPAHEPAAPVMKADRRMRIVVDAGHGGKDSGATGRHRTREKDINLAAALELAALLKQEKNFDVMLVRDHDVFVPLDERSDKSNRFNADLFVSIHCNAASSKKEHGFEIYFLSEKASDPEAARVADVENSVLRLEGKSEEDMDAAGLLHMLAKTEFMNDASELAGLVTKNLAKRVDLHNRGVKQAAFYVLRGTNAPAILVELGFVTNSKDEAKLESKRFRKRLIEGIYSGVVDYAHRRGWRTDQ
ncbi:MAG: N-acetylmuramoyl-L-alanine amidase [Elusimicrobia bacterium]|nr:N-acetylmuramoyl-L-alanine amidase [Elusimicrobiota bacterium]